MAATPPSPPDAATAPESVIVTRDLALEIMQLYYSLSKSLNAPEAKMVS
jgi:hypothetical protein